MSVTGAGFTGVAGFATGLAGEPQSDSTQRSAAFADLGICFFWAAVGQGVGLGTGLTTIPVLGLGAVAGACGGGFVVCIPTQTVTDPEYMAEPCVTPDAEAASGEQAIAAGPSINTKVEAIKRLEKTVASFVVVNIAKR